MRQNFYFRALAISILLLLPFLSIGQSTNTSQLVFEQPYQLQRADINSVTVIFKDSHHFMWFGTENGLYRYDGVSLKYFGHIRGDSASLPHNNVLGIAEDKDNKLWVATITGIAQIDLTTLKCRTFRAIEKKSGEGNYTNKICVDEDGNIWVGNSSGIFLFDKKLQSFNCVWSNKVPEYMLSNYVTSLVSVDKHLLAASTFHDLILFNKDDHSFKRVPVFVSMPPKDSTITSLLIDSKRKLWVGTWGGGIYSYDLIKNKLSHIDCLQSISELPSFWITSLNETKLSKQRFIWATSSIGLVKCFLDNDDNISSCEYICHNKNVDYSIISGKIECTYLDSDLALWCGGVNGVCKCFPFQNNLKLFPSLPGLILDIQPIKIGNENSYFINSWNSITGQGFLFTDTLGNISHTDIDPRFTDPDDKRNISGIAKDKYNRFWFSSMAGVSVLNDKFDVVKQWNKNTGGDNNLTYYRTYGITMYRDTAWVICYHRGIDLFDMSFKKLHHYSGNDGSGLIDNYIFSFFTDSKGNLWICGDNYLYRYLPATGKFKPYNLCEGTNGCRPRDMVEAKNGNLMIASETGLIQFNPVTEKYSIIHSSLLDKEQNIPAVAIDRHNDIWFLTDKHLVHYMPGENRFILFGKEDGLDISMGLEELRTFNGTDFYLCQDHRIIKFNCDSLNQPGLPPYLTINMQVNDSNLYSPESTDWVLPYNKNRIQFEFTGISYIKAYQTQYYYQLSDVDKQWNITYRNAVSYASLAPGHYSFKVKAMNYAGMWSDEKTILFTINPPYWQTAWFRILSAIIVFSILFFIIRYVSQRNLKERILRLEKETAVEKERSRIAQDMHDDLGSGLTKIAILSEVVKKQIKEPEKASEQLDRISDSSRTLVDNLQDIVWMLNTKHDRLDSLGIYIREYATKYFEQSNTLISFEYPNHVDSVKINDEQRRNLFMAIKEALNNIAKHAMASSVKLSFALDKNTVCFIVSDNGKGFNVDETRKFSNGVKNMQSRMKQAGGACTIVSKPGTGTTITLSVKV
ncbi:MAG TPA: two-component regulator propeller domain-containing protein [Bacteroidia bacterium]|jgi:signal transduction histidine kinase/ligand-binding sensor domain-containing protein|nr:two-component regulator propeller domain-containing protein [Bacteroidia bacterium]